MPDFLVVLIVFAFIGALVWAHGWPQTETPPLPPTAPPPEPPSDPMSPGYGLEDKTFGDARMADFSLPSDAPLMKDVLSGRDGVYLGSAMGKFDRDWIFHSQHGLNYTGPRHMMTVAPTRSGKGACAIIPNILTMNRSLIVTDPKAQNAAVTAGFRKAVSKTFLLNPFNELGLGTSRFNPLAVLSIDDPHVFAKVASLSESLIITEGKDPHWPDSARNLVAVLILHLLATRGNKATLPQIREYLGLPQAALIKEIEKMMRSPYPFIGELAGQFLDTTDEIKNIVSSARTQTKFLSDPVFSHPDTGVLTGDDFRLANFKKEVSTLYLILPEQHMAAYARFFRLMIVSALDQLMASPGGGKTLFILDEFKMLGHLSAIETAFGLAAGYNVQLWPFLQNLGQLRDVYGDAWHSFMSGCGFTQFFAPNDDFTAEFISKRIGDFTQFVANTSTGTSEGWGDNTGFSHGSGGKHPNLQNGRSSNSGTSSGVSWSKVGLRLVTPPTVMALPEDKQYIFLNGLKYPIMAFRRPYWRLPGVAECAAPDPFHQGEAAE
ncbi:type IV secretory system conjugative DNA transfer family protein [Bradyrhizobium acaciae]|uniref:type IV secretory system conjugative DNA transfer family protein n=1 Tax=Bradyrhizobium acaciae TaxID=2683706 RepID=UPI001E4C19F2|nr:type IV secretory system conjugative DNA transfer family protein [Bradyrhizobium acaciae]MCC8978885.1 type IV secretory system conjugative DNA transfer family protein [Bradyrhizobium acaciae]